MPTATRRYQSWGRHCRAAQVPLAVGDRGAPLPAPPPGMTMLPFGLGRSYGDSCLNDGGALLLTRQLRRFVAFDPQTGVLECEAGVSLAEILALAVPRGWFLPVSPGTRFVTLGGAIANDVHGKNHHVAGTFGAHVRRLTLLRSTAGGPCVCSPAEESTLFAATIGGLGLTGLILTAEIQLSRLPSEYFDVERVLFGSLDEFFALAAESDRAFTHTVAWVDCLNVPGRGVLFRARHAAAGPAGAGRRGGSGAPRLAVPPGVPGWLLTQPAMRLFNEVYFRKQAAGGRRSLVHYEPFFYPLDAVAHWNRLYGRQGFFQYQCVVPVEGGHSPLAEALREIRAAGAGSFLAVLKLFGDVPSPGMLSFPRPGVTLALDFANRGERTLALLERLDRLVVAGGGAVYPAKDARMSPASFQAFYPRLGEFLPHVDPAFSSSFFRRVVAGMGVAACPRAS